MICRNCGNQIDDSSQFCTFCGQKREEQVPAEMGAAANPNYICANCGNPVDVSSQFCTFCGQKREEQAPAEMGAAANPNYICANCGNPVDGSSQFCTCCGQKRETQVPVQMGANTAPNPNYAGGVNPNYPYNAPNNYPNNQNYPGNANVPQPKKKNHTVPIVISAVAAVLVIAAAVGCFIRFGLRHSPDDNNVAHVNSVVSATPDVAVPKQPDSVDELLGYVDQAETLLNQAYSDFLALNDQVTTSQYQSQFRAQADVLGDVLSELSNLQTQANAVSGLDANLKSAQMEYFNMAYDSQMAFYETWDFFAVMLDKLYILDEMPNWGNYNSIDTYYNALDEWYESVQDAYAEMDSCPSWLAVEWEQFGDILDLNDSILSKLYEAYYYDDVLRLYSARYMQNRFETMENVQLNEFINFLDSEADHFIMQRNVAFALAEELHAYADLDEKERSRYEFENVCTGEVVLNYETVDTIYPSLYNTYDAFLIVQTGCVSGTRKILVEAEIPGLTQKYKESFTLNSAYTAIYIKPPALTGSLDLSSAKSAQINVTVYEQDGNTVIESKTFPITIKSKYDVEWYTDEYGAATQDNILCFLTPESTNIADLKRLAIDEMSAMTSGTVESFAGYQNVTSWDYYVYTYLQAAGLMRAMYETGVRYNMDPYSISGSNQHILFPDDVLKQKSGLCIETSLVIASALQSTNMHVFLVFPPGHAQVAVETWAGSGEYFLIETTALSSDSNSRSIFIDIGNQLINEGTMASSGSPIMYKTSDQWDEYLSVPGTYLIDCADSRILGLTTFAN